MKTRWAVAIAGIVALAAVATNYYMPWLGQEQPMERVETVSGEGTLACPADAKPAPLNFTLKDLDGKPITLSQYKGKVLLIDFWATWCPPCKVEIPGFIELYDKYKGQGFQPVGIIVLDEFSKAKPFAEEMKMNYPVLDGNDNDRLMEAFGPIAALPVTFLISRDGKVCAMHPGYADKQTFEEEIKALL